MGRKYDCGSPQFINFVYNVCDGTSHCQQATRQNKRPVCWKKSPSGDAGNNRYTAAQFNTKLHGINNIYLYIFIYMYIIVPVPVAARSKA